MTDAMRIAQLFGVLAFVLSQPAAFAAEPARVPTHRVVVVAAEAAPSKATGDRWDPLAAGSCDLFVRVSRRDSELERQWTQLQSQLQQRRLETGLVNNQADPVLAAIAKQQMAVAEKFINETSVESGLRHEWNHESLKVATGDVLLVQVLEKDVAEYDVVGNTQWRVTAEALMAGKPLTLSFGRVVELTLDFQPLGAADAAPDAPQSRAEKRLRRDVHRHIAERIDGDQDDAYVLALIETSWQRRGTTIGDAAHVAAFFADILFVPVVILSDGEASITAKLPPQPPRTFRVDYIHFEAIKGRQACIDRVMDYTTQLIGLPAFPDGVPRVRSFAIVGREAAIADAERTAQQFRDNLEALRTKR